MLLPFPDLKTAMGSWYCLTYSPLLYTLQAQLYFECHALIMTWHGMELGVASWYQVLFVFSHFSRCSRCGCGYTMRNNAEYGRYFRACSLQFEA